MRSDGLGATLAWIATPGSEDAMGARLLRDDVRLFQIGAAVIAIAVLDHAFVHPEPGTSAGDHLASGLIPTAITVLAALSYPRLRRACGHASR